MNKKLLIVTLLVAPVFTAMAGDKNHFSNSQSKTKKAHLKVLEKHQHNWHQPVYVNTETLYQCVDSWDHPIKGHFSREQQYFIELGGGSCYKVNRYMTENRAYENMRRYNFPTENVYHAIGQIEHIYRLENNQLIATANIDASRYSINYTLVFKTTRHRTREFRVKQDRTNGRIKEIFEV